MAQQPETVARNLGMKLGFVLPLSLPSHGGAETYEYRLAVSLAKKGLNIKVFSGTPEDSLKENGNWDIQRVTGWARYQQVTWTQFSKTPEEDKPEYMEALLGQYLLVEEAIAWVEKETPDLLLLGIGWAVTGMLHARELIQACKQKKIPVGIIHHDTTPFLERIIVSSYLKTRSWAISADTVTKQLAIDGAKMPDLALYACISSPLIFRPDLIITPSNWSAKFCDPFNRVPKFTMHPIVSEVSRSASNAGSEKMFDVLMINPQNRKNPELMAKIINLNPHLTFKVLKGGWNSDPFETFVPAIEETEAYKNGSVTLVDYERDMAQVYSSTRLMFFPSYIEGYGMAAVEPMFLGTPVLASNYPPIIEAVGEKIDSLCPYINDDQEWSERLNAVLDREDEASTLSQLRAIELKAREDEEVHALIEFLKSMILKLN